jgi:hypothetical protein
VLVKKNAINLIGSNVILSCWTDAIIRELKCNKIWNYS